MEDLRLLPSFEAVDPAPWIVSESWLAAFLYKYGSTRSALFQTEVSWKLTWWSPLQWLNEISSKLWRYWERNLRVFVYFGRYVKVERKKKWAGEGSAFITERKRGNQADGMTFIRGCCLFTWGKGQWRQRWGCGAPDEACILGNPFHWLPCIKERWGIYCKFTQISKQCQLTSLGAQVGGWRIPAFERSSHGCKRLNPTLDKESQTPEAAAAVWSDGIDGTFSAPKLDFRHRYQMWDNRSYNLVCWKTGEV